MEEIKDCDLFVIIKFTNKQNPQSLRARFDILEKIHGTKGRRSNPLAPRAREEAKVFSVDFLGLSRGLLEANG